jgi:hypothetical protein
MSASIVPVRGVLFLMRHPRRIAALVTGLFGASLYVWFAAVRAVPGVKERKLAERREREAAWKP